MGKAKGRPSVLYQLKGALVHRGSPGFGHYYSFARVSPKNEDYLLDIARRKRDASRKQQQQQQQQQRTKLGTIMKKKKKEEDDDDNDDNDDNDIDLGTVEKGEVKEEHMAGVWVKFDDN